VPAASTNASGWFEFPHSGKGTKRAAPRFRPQRQEVDHGRASEGRAFAPSRNSQKPSQESAKASGAEDKLDTKKSIAQTGLAKALVAARHQGKRRAGSAAWRLQTDRSQEIAASLKRSAERSTRRKSGAYRSALSMLTFYINRAGKTPTRSAAARQDRAKAAVWKRLDPVIPGRARSERAPESMTTTGSMDSGPAPRGASPDVQLHIGE
jgi:Protein of unknown function (DUF3175)